MSRRSVGDRSPIGRSKVTRYQSQNFDETGIREFAIKSDVYDSSKTVFTDGQIEYKNECEGRIEKSIPRIAFWHHEACRVMTNGDPEGRIFSIPSSQD